MNNNILNVLNDDFKPLLEGVIIASEKPEFELDEENKIVTLTFFKNTYIRIGLVTYRLKHDISCFSEYTDNCLIYLVYNPVTELIIGYDNLSNVGCDNISIGTLLFKNGVLENISFINECKAKDIIDLSMTATDRIVFDNSTNFIRFPYSISVSYASTHTTIDNHNTICMENCDEIKLYYNTAINKFSINCTSKDNSILVAVYDRSTNKIGFNAFPELICTNIVHETSYVISNWSYNYNTEYNKIEWDRFFITDISTGETFTRVGGELDIEVKDGVHFIIFDNETFNISELIDPVYISTNYTILDTYEYINGSIIEHSNKIDKKIALEGEVDKLKVRVNEKIIDSDNGLVLPKKIFIIDNNPILKSCMTVSGDVQNQVTIIDMNNKISYPCMEVDFEVGINSVYSGVDEDTVTVYKYNSDEVAKTYKFGLISDMILARNILPLPGDVVFNHILYPTTFEYLVGMDTSNGASMFTRIAGSLDKEKYPSYCFRRTGSKKELSYSESSDKSGDFYIFDLRYYLLNTGLNDNDPLTHLIISCDPGDMKTALESIKILYTIIYDTYPDINIGFIPMVKHGPRTTNAEIAKNKIRCDFVNEVVNHIDLVDETYKVDVLPMWLYVNPMVSNSSALIHEAWNCIVGWAYSTL